MAMPSETPGQFTRWLGRPVPRIDGEPKVTGGADYALEHDLDDLTYAVVVQSTIGAGRIRSLDVAEAAAAPGVVHVFTHENAPRLRPSPWFPEGSLSQSFLPLQDDVVRFNGQHLALVVANTLEEAVEAARLVRIDYEPAEAVVADLEDPAAQAVSLESLGEPSRDTRRGEPEAALAAAPIRVEGVYVTPRECNCPIEPHGTLAAWSEMGGLTVWEPTQWPEGARKAFADWLELPIEKVRVISPYVGGGFGAKLCMQPHPALAAAAARELKRPVKLVLALPQTFTAYGGRPATRQHLALGAGEDGKLQAIVHSCVNETSFDDVFVESGGALDKIMYATPNLSSRQQVVRVNAVTPGFMRAPGEAVSAFALESAMDELAHRLGLDPIELRLRNWADEDPQAHKPWSTRRLREAYAAGAEAFGWSRRKPEPRAMRDGHQLIGWGMAGGGFPVYSTPAEARVRILADGSAEVETSGADIGTGTYTILAQTAAEALGIAVERVRVRLGDTALPRAPLAGGSQLANLLTGAVYKTAMAVREELLALATSHLNSPLRATRPNDLTIEDGWILPSQGAARGVSIPALLSWVGRTAVEATTDTLPPGATEADRRETFGTGQRIREPDEGDYSIHSWSAQFAEVRVDEDFGTVRVSRMVGAFDCGRVYNPRLAESQMMGGMIMGLGQALLEAVHVDRRYARITDNNLADYLIPAHADAPRIEVVFVGEPDAHASALGGKAVGELGMVGAAAAIANAVFHATGQRVRDLPITMEKLLRPLEEPNEPLR